MRHFWDLAAQCACRVRQLTRNFRIQMFFVVQNSEWGKLCVHTNQLRKFFTLLKQICVKVFTVDTYSQIVS
jgi:hypothetical protein